MVLRQSGSEERGVVKFCAMQHGDSVSDVLGVAIRSAKAAGDEIQAGYGQLIDFDVKAVGDLVSEVDRRADRAACDILAAASSLPILSEELNSNESIKSDLWIVDPLDATTAFLLSAGPMYPSSMVALRRAGQIELGVVYFPLTGDWFYAQRGRGAWRNGRRLVLDVREGLSEAWVEMNHYGNSAMETDFFAILRSRLRSDRGAQLVTSNVPHSGVAMRIAACENKLAAAIHDNNPSSPKQAAWDIAAPQIIMEEAGGVFLNPLGEPTDPFKVEPIIVARSRAIAQQIIALANEVSPQEVSHLP